MLRNRDTGVGASSVVGAKRVEAVTLLVGRRTNSN